MTKPSNLLSLCPVEVTCKASGGIPRFLEICSFLKTADVALQDSAQTQTSSHPSQHTPWLWPQLRWSLTVLLSGYSDGHYKGILPILCHLKNSFIIIKVMNLTGFVTQYLKLRFCSIQPTQQFLLDIFQQYTMSGTTQCLFHGVLQT